MDITGNTVLITGGGSGIGLALARAFHAQQNSVIIVGRDPQKLAEARRQCPGLHTIQADITKEDDRLRLVADIREHFPALNILVNNAGVAFISDLATDPEAFDKFRLEAETNYLAPVRLTQLLLGLLQRHASAAVINITTIGAYLPVTIMPGYSASKAALSSFTRSLRLQLAATPVKVFEILPPPVDTELVAVFHMDKLQPEQLAARVLQGLKKDREMMPIGTARVLLWMARLAPRFFEGQSHKLLLKATRRL